MIILCFYVSGVHGESVCCCCCPGAESLALVRWWYMNSTYQLPTGYKAYCLEKSKISTKASKVCATDVMVLILYSDSTVKWTEETCSIMILKRLWISKVCLTFRTDLLYVFWKFRVGPFGTSRDLFIYSQCSDSWRGKFAARHLKVNFFFDLSGHLVVRISLYILCWNLVIWRKTFRQKCFVWNNITYILANGHA